MGHSASANEDVKAWAAQMVGHPVVGSGGCYEFVDKALSKYELKSAPDFGKITDLADYRWGTKIDEKQISPGDVLQFRGYFITVVTKITTRTRNAQGDWHVDTRGWERVYRRGHHTAIVLDNLLNGELIIAEQGLTDPMTKQPLGTIQENTIPIRNSTNKTTETTRPHPEITVETTTIVRVKISGSFKAYRPQAR